MFMQNEKIRDIFFEIASKSKEFTLSKVIVDQALAKMMLDATTVPLIKLLNECTYETKGTQLITQVLWPKDIDTAVFRSDTCLLWQE